MDNVHALNEEWRRVASTHNLQDLLNDESEDEPAMTNKTAAQRLIQKIYG